MRTATALPPLVAAALLVVAFAILPAQQPAYDLVIRNARIVDGSGSPWFRGDIAVRGDTIAVVARTIEASANRVIDAAGLTLAPGFVDIHVHAFQGAGPLPAVLPILEVPTADNYIRQGVTTIVSGPDGFSPVPLGPVLERVRRERITPNLGTFIGHGSIREAVIGTVNRAASPAELERMRTLVRNGMNDGAFGLSTGLFYVPATFARTDEVIDLARLAGAMGGIHISHMRDEARGLVTSVQETIRIGEEGALPTQVTHHKTVGKPSWGQTAATLQLVDEARRRGVDATVDVYPYTASATSIAAALLPAWAQEGGTAAVMQRLRDPVTRRRVLLETIQLILEERGGGDAHNVQISACAWNPALDGKRLDEVAVSRGLSPSLEDAADSALWLVENGGCAGIYHAADEGDVQRVLKHPASMVASDGSVVAFGQAVPHPRSYGTFARVLGHYVRELNVISLEEAVRKMTSFPAQRLGLPDRGILRPGMKADLVLFDAATVRDMATYERPHQYAEGFNLVVVNGQIAFENGVMTGVRSGQILVGPAGVR
jgi:N-acyl-D-amino-acid deacylase